MFANLSFCMVNSIGIRTSVSLSEREGLVEYVIGFQGGSKPDSRRGCLGKRGSEKLLRRIESRGIVDILFKFVDFGLDERGDFWDLSITDEKGRELRLSGDEDGSGLTNAVVQDLAEILDDQFGVTKYIKDSRIDGMEISFAYNELSPEMQEYLKDYERCDHRESICIERDGHSIRFFRLYPSCCYRLGFECRCDDEVRLFLDQTGEIFTDDSLFEDVNDDTDSPEVVFSFTFHNGKRRTVRRSLSLEGLRDMQYIDMLNFLSEVLLHVIFKRGLFDRRFMFPKEAMERSPFFVAYCEEEDEGSAE